MAGLPESALALGAQSAAKEGHEGATPEAGPWVFTLDMPSYQPVLTHAENRCTRDCALRVVTGRLISPKWLDDVSPSPLPLRASFS